MAESSPAGSGGSPGVSAPPRDGSLLIRGGIGGVSFQFEELLAGAAALDGLVRQLQMVEVEADTVRRALFPYQSDSYTSGSNAIIAVGEAGRDVGRVRSQLQRIGDDVRASHREYEYAEARNALLLRMGLHGSEYGAAPEPFALPGVRGTVEGWVAMAPRNLAVLLGLPWPLAAVASALAGPTDIRRLVRDASEAPGLVFLKPRPVSIVGRETFTADVDLSPAGLLRRAGAVGEQGGRIEVIEVDGGSRPAWVVIIPGTQQGALPEGTNPFDPAGIAEALGYDSASTAAGHPGGAAAGRGRGRRSARGRRLQPGRDPRDESQQGPRCPGRVRPQVRADRGLAGGRDQPARRGSAACTWNMSRTGCRGRTDWPNPDTRDRVTVTLTNPLAVPPPQDFGLGPGHRLENYADGAATRLGEPGQHAAGLDGRAGRSGGDRRGGDGDPVLAPARGPAGTAGNPRSPSGTAAQPGRALAIEGGKEARHEGHQR